MQSKFSVMPFQKMSWEEWKFQYFSDIRVNHELHSLKKPKTGITLAQEDTWMFLPWYKKGNWRYGEPRRFELGKNLALVRSPAVKYEDNYLFLDSIHRLTTLKPAMVVIDWVEVKKKERKLVTDLIGDFWD